jgi:NAD(P)-dependent dehydrogenase (short-subunit alcohol dehydrogenase family)
VIVGRFEGKVAIVTGATSGMGRAIAERLAGEGAAVVLSGRDRARGEEAESAIEASGGRARFVAGDVGRLETNAALVDAAVAEFGGLDVLVPNAGILGIGSVTEIPLELWHEAINTNLNGVFYLLRLGIPKLQERGGGAVVITSSIAAFKGFPNHPAYCASKGGLVPLTRQLAIDYAPEIRVNAVCPGPVDTPLLWDSAKAFPDPTRAVSDVAEKTLLKRLGTPADVADAVLFLASDESRWITGASLTIDGGIMTGG